MNITSAAGIISLLEEPRSELKVFALKRLNNIVDEFWPEISEAIEKIEILHEDQLFLQRRLAGLVASKVYYHLGSFEDSLTYALGAGDLFDVSARTEYVETLLAKCIDYYTQQRSALADGVINAKAIDPRLESIVNRMFNRCLSDGQYRQAMGLALETRRMDIFEASITQADDMKIMLTYAFEVAMSLIQNRGFRNTVLRSLVSLYRGLSTPDYVNMCQCLIFLEDPLSVAEILSKLVSCADENRLMAYQIAFDLYESATQQFLEQVQVMLKQSGTTELAQQNMTNASSTSTNSNKSLLASTHEECHQECLEKLTNILSGSVSIELHLQFLIRSNHSDCLILKQTKETVRVSICHTATVIANGFMNSGTTSDQFLRENLEWLARATNWSKLAATASLGVIHRGHEQEALKLMQSYLPKEVGPTSGYSEGGGLYALGLIHANHGAHITDYLLNQLKDAQNEMVRHGGCLGLGLAAMGNHRQDVYEQLKFNLYQDDANTGEAAGIAMGLVMLGSKNASAIEDMVAYAQESQHEKILRGLSVGIALTMYGRLEEAEPLIQQLTSDKDPILRRSGMYTIAMAYCGTENNQAIRKLLHVAVSDVNDDVRRAAVTALGFILFRTPEHCPSAVSLLAESYNPHVRYGAAMALGIACAGTGQREAIALLEPMVMFDPVNFVRQGALIASAMILIQHTEQTCPKVSFFRQTYAQVIANKHEDVMAKFGAILAQGIIDAGGRNATLSLQSRTGHNNMLAIVGTLVFTQYWYWFPLSHFLALSFTPTCVIAINEDLKMPKLDFKSNAKPSLYAYPAPLEEKKREEREKVATAVLSIAARLKRRDHEKNKQQRPESNEKMDAEQAQTVLASEMCIDDDTAQHIENSGSKGARTEIAKISPSSVEEVPSTDASGVVSLSPDLSMMDSNDKRDKKDDQQTIQYSVTKESAEKKREAEPTSEILANPARVMRQQLKVLSLNDLNQYLPLKEVSIGGIIVVQNLKPGHEEVVEIVAPFGPKGDDEKEPDPPEPFEWSEN